MNILYLDCVGGIAGDMTVAALLELGVPLEFLREGLAALGVPEIRIGTEKALRHGIAGTRFVVTPPPGGGDAQGLPVFFAHDRGDGPSDVGESQSSHEHERHSHEGHGHSHPHSHDQAEHHPAEPAGHHHGSHPETGRYGHEGPGHRPYAEIRKLIAESPLPEGARGMALRIFEKLAVAEGAVHAVPLETVIFHEVGAWDSIADIVCTALAVERLAPEAIYCSPVPVGSGTVKTAHGTMPVPAPATLELLRGFPVVQGGPAFERTTPTGAAILAALARPAPDPFTFVPERIGVGVGSKDVPEVANVMRAVLGRMESGEAGAETIECAEANLDDANPEWIGYLMERLLAAGALDVALLPIQMKKNRPGTQIQVLYRPEQRAQVQELLFSEATTLGVRYRSLQRMVLPREEITLATPWGEIRGKVAHFQGKARFSPEFESCREAALKAGVPLRDVYQAAEQAVMRSAREGG